MAFTRRNTVFRKLSLLKLTAMERLSVRRDLDPIEAPRWTLRARFAEQTRCLMEECLTHFLKLADHKQSIEEIIGQLPPTASEPDYRFDIAGALQRLTQSRIPSTLSGVVNATTLAAFSEDESPVPAETMDAIMKYLFPGSDEDSLSGLDPTVCEEDSVPLYKTAPSSSLTHRLAVALCLVNYNFGGIRAVAYLWREIVLELRYRWEHGKLLPSLADEAPNLHYCLLHQKLQMLNHCIRQKQKQLASHVAPENQETKEADPGVQKEEIDGPDDKTDSSDTEEFFEAVETPDQLLQSDSNHSVTECDGWEAEGILHQLGSEVLINNGRPLYVPQTQEPLVMTEDMVVELSERLSNLGTSEEAARLRARMQSAQLLSDMQAFKAANPGCVLADFVRWYSPRDWSTDSDCDEMKETPKDDDHDKPPTAENDWDIVDADSQKDTDPSSSEDAKLEDQAPDSQALFVRGHLSVRMEQPGNFWKETWEDVTPQPVRRQKRLFDDTVEVEKVLHMFSGLSVCELVFLVLPVILHHAVTKLQEQQDINRLTSVQDCISSACASLSKIAVSTEDQRADFEETLKQISKTELLAARAKSLREKLDEGLASYYKKRRRQDDSSREDEVRQLIDDLLTEQQALLRGAARGSGGRSVLGIVQRTNKSKFMPDDGHHPGLPEDAKVVFPASAGREFILRLRAPRPSAHLEPIPQRMYCVLAPDEFRLAGAFTNHTTYH